MFGSVKPPLREAAMEELLLSAPWTWVLQFESGAPSVRALLGLYQEWKQFSSLILDAELTQSRLFSWKIAQTWALI